VAYAGIALASVWLSPKLSTSKRYGLEFLSIPTDLLCAILFLVKGALLNSTRLDCQALMEEKCETPACLSALDAASTDISALVLDNGPVNQQITSLMKRVFGRVGIDDVDRQCATSLFIYWVSVITMYVISRGLSLRTDAC
jgi:hypothetical protein